MRLIDEHRRRVFLGVKEPEYDLVYSAYKIVPDATTPFSVINNLDAVTPITFDGNFMDMAQITAASNGALTKLYEFPDQTGNFPTLINAYGNGHRVTDGSGNALDHLDSPYQQIGMYSGDVPDLKMKEDFIVWYVMRNETQLNNQRANFHIRTTSGGDQGITVAMRPSGSNYIIGVIHNSPPTNTSFSERRFVVNRSANATNFWLFTFTKIGGVLKMYINNVERAGDFTDELVFGYYNGIAISVRDDRAVTSGGKIHDFHTLIMKRGSDLSGYDLSAKNIELMTLHGIT